MNININVETQIPQEQINLNQEWLNGCNIKELSNKYNIKTNTLYERVKKNRFLFIEDLDSLHSVIENEFNSNYFHGFIYEDTIKLNTNENEYLKRITLLCDELKEHLNTKFINGLMSFAQDEYSCNNNIKLTDELLKKLYTEDLNDSKQELKSKLCLLEMIFKYMLNEETKHYLCNSNHTFKPTMSLKEYIKEVSRSVK